MMLVTQTWIYQKEWNCTFKQMNRMVYEFYVNKALIKKIKVKKKRKRIKEMNL